MCFYDNLFTVHFYRSSTLDFLFFHSLTLADTTFFQHHSSTCRQVQIHEILAILFSGLVFDMGDSVLTTVSCIVTGQSHFIIRIVRYRYFHLGEGLGRIEVKGKQQALSVESNDLIVVSAQSQIAMRCWNM